MVQTFLVLGHSCEHTSSAGTPVGEEGVIRAEHNAVLAHKLDEVLHGGSTVTDGIEVHLLEVVRGLHEQAISYSDIMFHTGIQSPYERWQRSPSMRDQDLQIGILSIAPEVIMRETHTVVSMGKPRAKNKACPAS